MLRAVHEFFFDPEMDIRNRLLSRSGTAILSILLLYVLFIKWLGPALMKNRKPFELRKTIFAYNAAQVVCNFCFSYQLYSFIYEVWDQRCGAKDNPKYAYYEKKLTVVFWNIYLVKMGDLLDTVFFVLRKKDRQVTFLHTIHHVLVVFLFHCGMKQDKIGFYIVFGMANNVFIHCCTYTYYTLSILGPHMQKYLWWKKYLTELQMLQFIIDLVYMTHTFFSGCEEMATWDLVLYVFGVFIFVLLINFYIKSYMKNKK